MVAWIRSSFFFVVSATSIYLWEARHFRSGEERRGYEADRYVKKRGRKEGLASLKGHEYIVNERHRHAARNWGRGGEEVSWKDEYK